MAEAAGVVLGMVGILNQVQGKIDEASRFHRIVDGKDWKEDVDQIKLMRAILVDTGKQFLTSDPSITSIQDVLCDCQRRLSELAPLFGVELWMWNERADTDEFKRLARAPRYKLLIVEAPRRRRALQSFRESVVLLHQLSSAASTNEKLQLLSDAMRSVDVQTTSFQAKESKPSPQSLCEAQTNGLELVTLASVDRKTSLEKSPSAAKVDQEKKSHSSPSKGFMWDLLEQNFTFNAVISALHTTEEFCVTEVQAMQPKTPVRALMDTGAAVDAFMIHRKIISRAGLVDRIRALKKPIVFGGLKKATYSCTRCITLTWYVPKHMNSREDVFYVIEDAPFDILIPNIFDIGTRHVEEMHTSRTSGSRKSGNKGHLLFIGRKWKSHKEKKKAKAEYKEEQARERRNDLSKRKAQISSTANMASVPPPAVPTVAATTPVHTNAPAASTSGQLQVFAPIATANTSPQGSIISISRANTPLSSARPSGPSSITTTHSNHIPAVAPATKSPNQAAASLQGSLAIRTGSIVP